MSILSDNVIPGKQGKVFETNAKEAKDLEQIRSKLLAMEGIHEVTLNQDKFPKEFTVQTSQMVPIKDIEQAVISQGFHAVPKGMIEL
ncbi:heavy-metal-associated domain-containing protein [Algoriphagus kandeliae]|uniref:Heavy-metal-associated domain-containing protein n=1 Tax=Algoriphagus kandeliae TaxID=2562278 RepID=A0A4Y9QXI9_9BACT|nr:heavy-metal-associated domain-containing protein [Algoriphagus kandeliae]TFV95685.1 heavy-metal-associated domain-containing protein [Algoriphagus kandeliae]